MDEAYVGKVSERLTDLMLPKPWILQGGKEGGDGDPIICVALEVLQGAEDHVQWVGINGFIGPSAKERRPRHNAPCSLPQLAHHRLTRSISVPWLASLSLHCSRIFASRRTAPCSHTIA